MKRIFSTTLKTLWGLIRYKTGRPNPMVAQWEITYNCNFKCKFCNVWQNDAKREEELSFEEIKKVIDQLDSLGVVWITFTGGEPLLKKDLPKIVDYCNEKGMFTLMNENGYLLKNKVGELKKSLHNISISLDSHDKEINDEIRGLKGAFDKVVDSARESKKHINTLINMTVTSESMDSMEKMAELCKENGLPVVFTPVSVIPNEGLEKTNAKDVKVDPIKFHDTVKRLSKKYKNVVFFKPYLELIRNGGISKRNFSCNSAKLMVHIKPNGDLVYPCGYFPSKNFSVKNQSVKDIVSESKEFHDKHHDFCDGCTLACYLIPSLGIDNLWEFARYCRRIF